ncbi:hypothetical protein CC85DRAFT_313226 [Cutaneotrichosporon oleaginosum]|uniref:Uncharacterized protein n=1 Tax=Cutaneotrichosporon oleaginosum TaxID=879819 RepID=A0A0J0XHI0_9TREE|nr:uncharacterized protein CC85DRAFT_313226 [Cutaneotrichosporon oleaginosum]KLT40585.1 hypothetical protein CC85DRAFT_313226 [Cutaneotrichosporon oleaginosum]
MSDSSSRPSSRPTSPSSAPPQRHVSNSLKDRIAKFENFGGGSSAPAPVPRPLGQGSYSRGGLVGNRLPSLDPKTAGITGAAGPRRVSERRDLIGNRVPSLGNANVAAALAPRHTGGSVGSVPGSATTPTTSTPAAATTAALGLGRPNLPKKYADDEASQPSSERSVSPSGSAKGDSVKGESTTGGSGPSSISGSASVASTSVVSAPDSTHSGSAPTSATSSPATSPGAPIPPQLLVSSLPTYDDAGSMTPLSTRAEAGEDAPSEFSMPTTPQATNTELPRPGYDLVPGNLALAAGPQSQAMAPSPSISSSLVSQYDPKSEGEESANLKDVSNVSTPTGTPRQAHKTLDDDGSIAGSVAGSTRGSTRGPDDLEEKATAASIDSDDATPEPEVTKSSAGTKATELAPPHVPAAAAADEPEPELLSTVAATPVTPTPMTPTLMTSENDSGAALSSGQKSGCDTTPRPKTATQSSPTAEAPKPAKPPVQAPLSKETLTRDEQPPTEQSPASVEAFKTEEKGKGPSSAVSAVAGVAASLVLPVAAVATVLSQNESEPSPSDAAGDPAAVVEHGPTAVAAQSAVKQGAEVDVPVSKAMGEATAAPAAADKPDEGIAKGDQVQPVPATGAAITPSLGPAAAVAEPPVPDVEELVDAVEAEGFELDPPKPDNVSDVTTIVPRVDSEDSSPFPSSGLRDRDVTPLGSTLSSLRIDDTPLDREATPVPDHHDPSQPPPALDDDSDIVSVLGGTMSERGDELASNRSSMPPARASSELEFRYEDLHERFFRENQAKGDASTPTENTAGATGVVAPVGTEYDGSSAGNQEASKTAPPPDRGVTATSASGGVSVAATTAGHSFRENIGTTSAARVDARSAESGVMSSLPSVPTTDPNRRPVQVHIEPSPHGVLFQPAVNVQAPSPLDATFENGQRTSISSSSSAETSRVPTPAHPAFPRAPGNDLPDAETPARGASPSGTPTLASGADGTMHSFPPVPDEEHPYVEVHVEHHHAHAHAHSHPGGSYYHRVPFPRSASERAVRTVAFSPPKRTSSLRAPLTPPSHAPFGGRMSPTPGSSPSPNLSVESFDRPPGSRSPGRKRNSFSPRSPLLDDEDPGDFEPGEGWAIVNRWEPWRSPSQHSM